VTSRSQSRAVSARRHARADRRLHPPRSRRLVTDAAAPERERLPLEHFEAEEQTHLLPKLSERYGVPTWSEPTVGSSRSWSSHPRPSRIEVSLRSVASPPRRRLVQARNPPSQMG
jgi:hypothetical protein